MTEAISEIYCRSDWTKATESLSRCLRLKGISEGDVFTLRDAMEAQPVMELIYPNNKNLDGKIRQQLQVMREHGHVEFLNNKGVYRMLK